MLWGHAHVVPWGRKDGFPGADGRTMQQIEGANATVNKIYDETGNVLTEGSTGVRRMAITTSGILNGNTSIVYVIKNPLTFVYNEINTLDWYTTNQSFQNNVLWDNGEVKSFYDPCPHGWRVPTNASLTYGDFITSTIPIGSGINIANGRIYCSMSWFPASGCCYANSGILYHVGTHGFYWSASASGMNAQDLSFFLSGFNLNYTDFRACGFSVRCVQE